MTSLIVLPILIPLFVGASCLLVWRYVAAQRHPHAGREHRLLHGLHRAPGADCHGGIQAVQQGDWIAPFGITLVADLFSAIMVAAPAW